jgi:hypothetical protein
MLLSQRWRHMFTIAEVLSSEVYNVGSARTGIQQDAESEPSLGPQRMNLFELTHFLQIPAVKSFGPGLDVRHLPRRVTVAVLMINSKFE